MSHEVAVLDVAPRWLAAVRARVPLGGVAKAFRDPLDRVWAFLRQHPGLRTDGHNVFLYHHVLEDDTKLLTVEFGVEVTRTFEGDGDVLCASTPAGRVAMTVHRGPYEHLGDAHDAVRDWCRQNGRTIGRASWEIYGDWSEDASKLETTVVYLLQ